MKRILVFALFFMFAFVVNGTAASALGTVPKESSGAEVTNAAEVNFGHVYLMRATKSPIPWWQTSTLVDASGGVHTAFYTNQAVVYAYCPAACDNSANWSAIQIADTGPYDSLTYPSLALDANSRPRLMWYGSPNYFYAECNGNCTNAANWLAVEVPVNAQDNIYPQTARYFTLDSQGHPHFVYYGSGYDDENIYMGLGYTTCDGECTNASNWHSSLIDFQEYISWPQIVLNAQDHPRIMGVDENNLLSYLACNSNCSQAANWGRVTLYDVGYDGHYSFRLDSQGRPRMALYSGDTGDTTLYYAWSNSTAISGAAWFSESLALPPNEQRTVDLVLDSQDRPHIVFASAQEDLDYTYCTANCDSGAATWQLQHIETGEELEIEDPVPTGPDCLSSVWLLVGYPSLALDAANQPSVSYYAQHERMCLGSDGQYHVAHDIWALRFATSGGTPSCYTLTTSVNPAEGGEVSANPGPNCEGGKYTAGTQVELSASPAASYHFDQWSGDVLGSANPAVLVVDGDKSVTANFTTSSGDACKIFLPCVVDWQAN